MDKTALRVMTFNIRGATYDDGENDWDKRASLNVRTILKANPDIIAFQEFQTGNLEVYRRALTGYHFVRGMLYNRPGRPFYHAIYWREDCVAPVCDGGFYLSETPDVWSKDWGAGRVHAVGWAQFRCLKTGVDFLFLNTHLDHISHQARMQSGRVIVDWALEQDKPIVLCGDFNSPPFFKKWDVETVHKTLLQSGFRDAYLEAGQDNNSQIKTVHGFHGGQFVPENTQRAPRVDWVLVRDGVQNIWVSGCDIIYDAEPPLYPSDHYPVIADVAFGSSLRAYGIVDFSL